MPTHHRSLFEIVLASSPVTMGVLGGKHLMLQLLLNLHYFCPLLLGFFLDSFCRIHIHPADADDGLVYVPTFFAFFKCGVQLLLLLLSEVAVDGA